MIVDLRDNPGGLVTESFSGVAALIPNKPAQKLVSRSPLSNAEFRWNDGTVIQRAFGVDRKLLTVATPAKWEKPVTVLVNSYSASCAEFFAINVLQAGRGAVIGEPLYEMAYEQRLKTLLKHRIGLWDIIGSCKREGSLDSNIRNPGHNDFKRVTGVAKKLRRVCFNGKTAAKMEPLFNEWGFETVVLPSSSPAYTLRFEEKLKHWRAIGAPFLSIVHAGARSIAGSLPSPFSLPPSRNLC